MHSSSDIACHKNCPNMICSSCYWNLTEIRMLINNWIKNIISFTVSESATNSASELVRVMLLCAFDLQGTGKPNTYNKKITYVSFCDSITSIIAITETHDLPWFILISFWLCLQDKMFSTLNIITKCILRNVALLAPSITLDAFALSGLECSMW